MFWEWPYQELHFSLRRMSKSNLNVNGNESYIFFLIMLTQYTGLREKILLWMGFQTWPWTVYLAPSLNGNFTISREETGVGIRKMLWERVRETSSGIRASRNNTGTQLPSTCMSSCASEWILPRLPHSLIPGMFPERVIRGRKRHNSFSSGSIQPRF